MEVREALRAMLARPGTFLLAIAAVDAVGGFIIRPYSAGILSLAMTAAGIPGLSNASLTRVLASPLALLLILVAIAVTLLGLWLAASLFTALAHLAQRGRPMRTGDVLVLTWRQTRALFSPLGPVFVVLLTFVMPVLHVIGLAFPGQAAIVPHFLSGFVMHTGVGSSLVAVAVAIGVAATGMLAPIFTLLATGRPDGRRYTLAAVLRPAFDLVRTAQYRSTWWLVAVVGGTGVLVILWALLGGGTGELLGALGVPAADAAATGLTVARVLIDGQIVAAGAIAAGTVVAVHRRSPGFVEPALPEPRRMRGVHRAGIAVAVLGAVLSTALQICLAFSCVIPVGAAPLEAVAHRGDARDAVENSIPAVRAAAREGAGGVELDVQRTRDGGFVVFHDVDLARLAGRSGRVADLTEAQLTGIELSQNGHTARIPSLDAVLRETRRLGIRPMLEAKAHGGEPSGWVEAMIRRVRRVYPDDAFDLESLDRSVVDDVEARHPSIRTVWLANLYSGHLVGTGADLILLDQTSYDDALAGEAVLVRQRLGAWIVDEPDGLRYLGGRGVTVVVTDDVAATRREGRRLARQTSPFLVVLDRLWQPLT